MPGSDPRPCESGGDRSKGPVRMKNLRGGCVAPAVARPPVSKKNSPLPLSRPQQAQPRKAKRVRGAVTLETLLGQESAFHRPGDSRVPHCLTFCSLHSPRVFPRSDTRLDVFCTSPSDIR